MGANGVNSGASMAAMNPRSNDVQLASVSAFHGDTKVAGDEPAYVPSADQLLYLFDQASKAHDAVSKGIGAKMQDSIGAKNGMSDVSNELQLLKFDPQNQADGSEVIAKLKELQGKVKDPEIQSALEAAIKIADTGDDRITKDEMAKLNDIVSGTITTIDTDMTKQTMALKQENDYFTSITAVIKEIMDSNTKVFNTIMGRG